MWRSGYGDLGNTDTRTSRVGSEGLVVIDHSSFQGFMTLSDSEQLGMFDKILIFTIGGWENESTKKALANSPHHLSLTDEFARSRLAFLATSHQRQ